MSTFRMHLAGEAGWSDKVGDEAKSMCEAFGKSLEQVYWQDPLLRHSGHM